MPRSEPVLLQPQQLAARLTLASGSRAGMVVNLHAGFYLIGRNAECQVRPKSRSVSRRHCLVRHQEGQLHVLDLGSTSGTRLNGAALEPRLWYPLADGDELRCGKIAFAVAAQVVQSPAADVASPAGGKAAWQAEDIADWMTDFDELEQAERIQSLRTQAVAEPSGDNAEPARSLASATDTGSAKNPPSLSPAASRARQHTPQRGAAPTRAAHRFRFPAWGGGGGALAGEGERWKTLLATALLVAALAWLLLSLFYFGDDNIYQQVKTLET